MAKKKTRRTSPQGRRSLGCLFWICLAAIIAAVAFAARAPLVHAFSVLFGGKPTPTSAPPAPPTVSISPLPQKDGGGTAITPPPARKESPAVKEPEPEKPVRIQTGQPETPKKAAPTGSNEEKPAIRKARLFFVSVDPSGKALIKETIRPVTVSDSPLRDAVEALLKGPTSQELERGLITMIPADSRLKSVVVKGDTAFLDFSESFRFNSMGIEGLTAQLRQIVYVATEFPTVKKAQILIEGKKVKYLGTEGIHIDEPLSRSSFKE